MSNKIIKNNAKQNKEEIKPKKETKTQKWLSSKQQIFENVLKTQNERMGIRRKYHITLWLIFFFPYGIYLSFKHKGFSKVFNIVLIIFILLLTIGLTDAYFNKNRILDRDTEKLLNEMSSDLNIGSIREEHLLSKLDDIYYCYDIITTTGDYDVYVSFNKDKYLEINAIKEKSPDKKTIYINDNFPNKYKDAYSEIITFITTEDMKKQFGEIEEVLESNPNNQKIKTSLGIYTFYIESYQVTSVYQIINDNENLVYNKDVVFKMFDDFQKIIDKNMDTFIDIKKITNYEITTNEITYTFVNSYGNVYKILKRNNGSFSIQQSNNNVEISK